MRIKGAVDWVTSLSFVNLFENIILLKIAEPVRC